MDLFDGAGRFDDSDCCNGQSVNLLRCTHSDSDRFGIAGPIPSARLKLKRNATQDINLIDAAAKAAGKLEQVRTRLSEMVPIRTWEKPPRAVVELPPEEWNGLEIVSQDGVRTASLNGKKLSQSGPYEVRQGLIGLQSEGKEIHWRKVRIKESK